MCPFCDPETLAKAVYETENIYIVKNKVFYDIWEMRTVKDHLLLMPKRHVKSLGELGAEERAEIMDVISDYESNDYNVYARAVSNNTRSVTHQHTHLIKTDHRNIHAALMLKKPYLLFKI